MGMVVGRAHFGGVMLSFAVFFLFSSGCLFSEE
jgi:hypothetical protein